MSIFKPGSVILKLSGEVLAGKRGFGFDYDVVDQLAEGIIAVRNQGFRIGIVIGGGNIFRGSSSIGKTISRFTADNMGMLATIQNTLLMADILNNKNYRAEIFSAVQCDKIVRFFTAETAMHSFLKGNICFFCAGTSNPFFTTDTAAVLRAIEMDADLVLKGTKVDGVYTSDPKKNKNAVLLKDVTYDQALAEKLQIMDMTAFSLARDNMMPIKIFNISDPAMILKAILEPSVGTLVHA
ncbi:MAG: UMP kinase [Candidatus Cloacimonetes bacterium]|nr:UMP kinase [Candidatus Cloacimonadota bacterium]